MEQPETQSTRHLSPVFGRRKTDSEKIRMINGFRLGSTPQVQNRKLANCGKMPVAEPTSDMGSCVGTIDLLLPPRTAPQRGEMDQNQDGDGRLSMNSPAFRSTLLPLLDGPTGPSREKTLRHQGVHLIWNLDEIIILSETRQSVSTNLEILLWTCNDAGLIIKKTKSQLTPSQQVNYLGQQINLRTRMVGLPPAKLRRGLEMTRAYLRRRKSSPAHIAGVARTLLDCRRAVWHRMDWRNPSWGKLSGCCMQDWRGRPTPCTLRNWFGC